MPRIALLLLAALLSGLVLAVLFGPGLAREARAAAGPGRVVLVVHGGAGVSTAAELRAEGLKREQFEQSLARALAAGYRALQADGATSVHGVEAAVRVLEDDELFNAGRGAALDADGQPSLDAAIMEGKMTGKAGEGKRDPRKRAGAVAAVGHIKNPISAARAVLEMEGQRHVLLVGAGAERFALGEANRRRFAIEQVPNTYFLTRRRLEQVLPPRESDAEGPKSRTEAPGGADRRFGTVGAVALKDGTLAAGTSTGGLTNKLPGRVGDSPLIGAGTYADDRACGVSCTGTGEVFIRHVVAHDVAARMRYKKGLSVGQAVEEALAELPDEEGGVGGLIALDARGNAAFGMSARSVGMYRGYVTDEGDIFVAVYRAEVPRRVSK